jgi:hypothetical protein
MRFSSAIPPSRIRESAIPPPRVEQLGDEQASDRPSVAVSLSDAITEDPVPEALALEPPSAAAEEGSEDEGDMEIDPRSDPIQAPGSISVAEWEVSVQQIVPRPSLAVDPEQVKQTVIDLMSRIRDVDLRSDPSRLAEAEALLASLPSLLRDPETLWLARLRPATQLGPPS